MRRRRRLPSREQAALPAAKIEQLPLVFDGVDRIIAPWPTHAVMTPTDQQRLLCVLDYVRAARPNCPLWLWPERTQPEPLQNTDPHWLARYSEGRAVYRAGSARRSG
jgi:hypothetical protein